MTPVRWLHRSLAAYSFGGWAPLVRLVILYQSKKQTPEGPRIKGNNIPRASTNATGAISIPLKSQTSPTYERNASSEVLQAKSDPWFRGAVRQSVRINRHVIFNPSRENNFQSFHLCETVVSPIVQPGPRLKTFNHQSVRYAEPVGTRVLKNPSLSACTKLVTCNL